MMLITINLIKIILEKLDCNKNNISSNENYSLFKDYYIFIVKLLTKFKIHIELYEKTKKLSIHKLEPFGPFGLTEWLYTKSNIKFNLSLTSLDLIRVFGASGGGRSLAVGFAIAAEGD